MKIKLNDRVKINIGLSSNLSLTEITNSLNADVSISAVAKEIKRNSFRIKGDLQYNSCSHKNDCKLKKLCSAIGCKKLCKNCKSNCNHFCDYYEREDDCDKLKKFPYVCNGCPSFNKCKKPKRMYEAIKADNKAEKRFRKAAVKSRIDKATLIYLNEIFSEDNQKNQSVEVIYNYYKDNIPYSCRHIRNLMNQGILPKLEVYKRRRKKRKTDKTIKMRNNSKTKIEAERDYLSFLKKDFPNTQVVEMDLVEGTKSSKKKLLSLLFRDSNFHVYRLLDDGSNESVKKALDDIEIALKNIISFDELIPIILTDNGPEFNDWKALEKSAIKKDPLLNWTLDRTKIYFCPPYSPGYKGKIEKNHTILRRFLPKGTSFNDLTQDDINWITSNINSYSRSTKKFQKPYDLFTEIYGSEITEALNIRKIASKNLSLKFKK